MPLCDYVCLLDYVTMSSCDYVCLLDCVASLAMSLCDLVCLSDCVTISSCGYMCLLANRKLSEQRRHPRVQRTLVQRKLHQGKKRKVGDLNILCVY